MRIFILKENSNIKTLIISVFLLFVNDMYAQQKFTDNLNGMLNFHNGYNVPEYPFIGTLTKDYIRSIDISLYRETTGKNMWEGLYNYPDFGVSLFYSTLGNDEVFGRELALTFFFKVYFSSKHRLRLFVRPGLGLNYVNRKFNFKNNYLNVAVGSNINIHFNFRLGANYALTDKWSINSGISFDHFSNANTSEPNLGINYLTGYAGLSFSLGQKKKKQIQKLKPHIKENSYVVFASIGGKHPRALVSEYFVTSSISFEFNRAFSRKFHFGFGSDLFYDSSVESSLNKGKEKYQSSDSFQTGIHLSQSIVYNEFLFSFQEGVYLLLKEQVDHYPIYTRGIIQYQISNWFLVRVTMKTHLHILDYPEIGFGYKF